MKTTIQISDSLRRRLKAMSSYRGISYTELLEDLIALFTSSIPFKSEEEFKEWFKENLDRFGFKEILEERAATSPDFRLKDAKGNILEVEVELVGDDFVRHGHDPRKTDLIVCMYSDKEKIDGVPVLSIIKPPEERDEVIKKIEGKFTSVSIPVQLFDYIKRQIKNTGFTSVSSYVAYILRQVIIEAHETGEMPFAREDAEKIRRRLRALGYLE